MAFGSGSEKRCLVFEWFRIHVFHYNLIYHEYAKLEYIRATRFPPSTIHFKTQKTRLPNKIPPERKKNSVDEPFLQFCHRPL